MPASLELASNDERQSAKRACNASEQQARQCQSRTPKSHHYRLGPFGSLRLCTVHLCALPVRPCAPLHCRRLEGRRFTRPRRVVRAVARGRLPCAWWRWAMVDSSTHLPGRSKDPPRPVPVLRAHASVASRRYRELELQRFEAVAATWHRSDRHLKRRDTNAIGPMPTVMLTVVLTGADERLPGSSAFSPRALSLARSAFSSRSISPSSPARRARRARGGALRSWL